jgi:16S rRNA (cytosine967-C5)-methyltransferase
MSKDAGTSSPRRRKSSSADPTDPRELAARVLARVWESSWAAPSLDAELGRAPQMDPRDTRLATELTYGVLRTQPLLEREIDAHATSTRWRKRPAVHAHVLIAAYTILFLDRVPAFAAVNSAVTAIRRSSDARVAGFANAVLRKLAGQGKKLDPNEAAAAAASPWLREALGRALGAEGAAAFLAAGPIPPRLGLCLRAGHDRAAFVERLRAAGADVEPGRLSPHAVLLRGGDPRRLPGAGSDFIVQEEGAQAVALLAGARAGERILDACAGRGGKAVLLADQGALVEAADLHPQKLAQLAALPGGSRVRATYAVDWTRGAGDVPAGYDRVLVDAPCSGTGTLRRRPEIGGRLGAADPPRLRELQAAILASAATRARPGGRVIYAVCSVLREEAEDVIALACADGVLEPASFDVDLGGGATALRFLPHVHGTDGYFVASLRVRD